MNTYIRRDDVLKALLRTNGMDFSETVSAVMDLPVVDLDERERRFKELKDEYVAHLKQDISDIIQQTQVSYAMALSRGRDAWLK